MTNDRASIVRWHENSARSLEHMAANEEVALRSDLLQRAAWHRRCVVDLVNRADEAPDQSFLHHPFRERWLEQLAEARN